MKIAALTHLFKIYCVGSILASGLFATTNYELVEPEITEKDLEHWSFQAVTDIQPPSVERVDQVRNPVDQFILARLEQEGLGLMPEANRNTLIRRLSFDLRGLPPSVEEVEKFMSDTTTSAYENLVDRFLASSDFGERWAQHWLDVARFAESDGFEHDAVRSEAWRYRDWVIQALNADLPYDEFLRLQIAGDELYPESDDAAIATGFLVAGADMPDINLMEERRHTVLNEMTTTTGLTFMGLTMGCAQCHDHKSDPISQADFYRLRAMFADMTIPKKSKQLSPRFIPLKEDIPQDHLMIRGDFRYKGPVVDAAFLRVVNQDGESVPKVPSESSKLGRRSALVDWLTDPNHPLTSRVAVNRFWQQVFGKPIVASPNDFGVLGYRPSHPELLDWLAAELVRQDWSIKELLRILFNSATYRQASLPVNEKWLKAMEVDPDNLLLSRMNRKRLEGEAIRDSMLAVSGKLNRKAGGPGVHPPLPSEVAITLLKKQWQVSEDVNDHYRRSIYLFVRRNLRFPMFDVFDRPDANASCGRRNISTTAPQSLTLLNSEFSIETARQLAGSIINESKGGSEDWVDLCYRRVLSRSPSADELNTGIRFIEKQTKALRSENRNVELLGTPFGAPFVDPYMGTALTDFCLAIFNLNEMIYLD